MIIIDKHKQKLREFHSSSKKVLEESAKEEERAKSKKTYNQTIMESKILKDAQFLDSLKKEYLNPEPLVSLMESGELTMDVLENSEKKIVKLDEDSKTWDIIFESILIDTIDLYKELNEGAAIYATGMYDVIYPVFGKLSKDTKILTEAQEIEIYNTEFKKNITKNFSNPLQENKFGEIFENEINTITTEIGNKGLSRNMTDENIELLNKFAIFENVIINEIKNVLVPKTIQESYNLFQKEPKDSYSDLFENKTVVLMENINNKSRCLGQLISVPLFEKGFDSVLEESDRNLINNFSGTSKLIINLEK